MNTLKKIYNIIDTFAPFSTCESWDNCGLLVRSENSGITKALLALDITPAVIEEAKALGAELIISHHPVIFEPISKLEHTHPVYLLAKYGISAICAHTNLDLAVGGVNDIIAQGLCLENIQPLCNKNENGLSLGRIGEFRLAVEPEIAVNFIKKNLGASGVSYTAHEGRITKVAVCGGSAGELILKAAELGADAFVTGEAKHHHLLLAAQLGIMLIVAGHYCTEQVVLKPLATLLQKELPEVEFSIAECEKNPVQYI